MTSSDPEHLGSWRNWHTPDEPLRLGVSSCLLGEEVRFNSGHARARFVTDVLAEWFDMVPVCPEVEIGMGIPRPTIRLVDDGEGEGLRLVAPSTGEDFTERMTTFAETRVDGLMKRDLDGYILKSASPSCGMERIKVFRKGMPARRNERGVFAKELMERWPALPVEEEGRLNDPPLRENFIERVFNRNRWRALVSKGLTRGRLVSFHTAHKLLIRAHNEAAYRRLGKLVASAGQTEDRDLYAAYETEFHNALKTRANPRKHSNVLQNALGHLKRALQPAEKREILTAIEDYRRGLLPLAVPLTLLRFNIRLHDMEYLAGQTYFDPHPKELMLRNHV